MKKLVCLLLALCLAISLSLMACGDKSTSSSSSSSSSPATSSSSSSTPPVATVDKAFCQQTFSDIASEIDSVVSGISPMSSNGKGGLTLKPYDATQDLYVEVSSTDMMHIMTVKGVNMFVKMLAEMLENDEFIFTENAVNIDFAWVVDSVTRESCNANLAYSVDVEEGLVTMTWDVESTSGGNTAEIFLQMNVDYDFDNNQTTGFSLYNQTVYGSTNSLMGYVYEDGVMKYLNPLADLTSVQELVSGYISAMATKVENVVDIEADFSAEYTALMNEMNGGM